MTIDVNLQQLRCARTTWELSDDEVYFVIAGIGEKKESNSLVKPADFDWKALGEDVKAVIANLADYKTWVKAVVKTFLSARKYFAQDDLIGIHCVHAAAGDTAWTGYREMEFTGWFAKYKLNMGLEKA